MPRLKVLTSVSSYMLNPTGGNRESTPHATADISRWKVWIRLGRYRFVHPRRCLLLSSGDEG